MEIPKRDRGLVRTPKDIEMKYNLGEISRTRGQFQINGDAVDELKKQDEYLSRRYEELVERIGQSEQKVMDLREEFNGKLGDIELLLSEV